MLKVAAIHRSKSVKSVKLTDCVDNMDKVHNWPPVKQIAQLRRLTMAEVCENVTIQYDTIEGKACRLLLSMSQN